MNKKIIAVAIALVLMVAVFAGCSKDGAQQATTTLPVESTTEATTKDLGADIPEWITDEPTSESEGDEPNVNDEPVSGSEDETTTSSGIEIDDNPDGSGHVDYNDLPIVGR